MQVILLLIFAASFRKSTRPLHSPGYKLVELVLTFIKIVADNDDIELFVEKVEPEGEVIRKDYDFYHSVNTTSHFILFPQLLCRFPISLRLVVRRSGWHLFY